VALRIEAKAEPIPGYRLIERLGRGGFGEVWKAEAPGGILKAVKFVYGNLDEASQSGRPAEQELKALNRVKTIRHPYILTIERFDIIEGQLLIVMELADRNLYNRFRECQAQGANGIPREELLQYMSEAAEALDLMNINYQIQHLDVKPQNLFLIFNHVKIADFGLAKDMEGKQVTLTGGVTPVYAAPETFEGQVTRFCDQYSLAIVFQEMLTSVRPFPGSSARQLMLQHLQSPPDLSSLRQSDQIVVERALAKRPEQRFPTCVEFVQALRAGDRRAAPTGGAIAEPAPAAQQPAAPVVAPTLSAGVYPLGESSKLRGLRSAGTVLPSLSEVTRLPPLNGVRGSAQAVAAAKPAPPEQTGPGTLLPAMFIGLGELGLALLQLLRRALKDRFGRPTLPHLRFLGIDTDPGTIQTIDAAAPTSLEAKELYLARLNRPSHYNKYLSDPAGLESWMSPQMLYRIPRNPATMGIRTFGRLAFYDHYRPLMQRIRGELETFVTPESLAEAEQITHLGLRTNRPRVYLLSSLSGGSGGGMFLDLAYAVRYQLKLLGYTHPEVYALLMVPTIDRSISKSQPVANAYAALTELVHFSAPQNTYEAVFDSREGMIVDAERPFSRCMLLQLPKTTDIPSLRPLVHEATGFLFRELFTPLGRQLDRFRMEATVPAGTPPAFHTFGSYRLTWPRVTMLNRATRRCAERLLRLWTSRESAPFVEPIRVWLEEQWVPKQLPPEAVRVQLNEACVAALQCEPDAAIDECLAPLEKLRRSSSLETKDVVAVLENLLQLVGQPELEGMPSVDGRLYQLLDRIQKMLGGQADAKLAQMAASFIETPGYRLPAAEEAMRQLLDRLRNTVEQGEPRIHMLLRETAEVYTQILSLMGTLDQTRRHSRKVALKDDIVVLMRQYARLRVELLLSKAVVDYYRSMINSAPEHLRESTFCRQRLEAVLVQFADSGHANIEAYLGPSKAILPPGCRNIDEAAAQLAQRISPADMLELDGRVQAEVAKQFSTLVGFCLDKADQTPALAELVLKQVRERLEPAFRDIDSASVYFQNSGADRVAHRDLNEAFEDAAPDLNVPKIKREQTLCLISAPPGEAGQRFLRIAEEALADERLSVVTGSDDIIIYREFSLKPADIPQLGPLAREACKQVVQAESTSAHARSDIEWQAVR
jgi:hypothetical protein